MEKIEKKVIQIADCVDFKSLYPIQQVPITDLKEYIEKNVKEVKNAKYHFSK